MERIKARIEASTEVARLFMNFAKKSMEEINGLHENALRNRDDVDDENGEKLPDETEVLLFNEKNFLALGGNTSKEGNNHCQRNLERRRKNALLYRTEKSSLW